MVHEKLFAREQTLVDFGRSASAEALIESKPDALYSADLSVAVVDDPLQYVEDALQRVVDIKDDAACRVDDLNVYRGATERTALELLLCCRLQSLDVPYRRAGPL